MGMMTGDTIAGLYPGLHRFACVVAPLEVEPDDLVQEAFVRTLRRGPLDQLEDAAAYLRRTIVHLAANQRRSLGRLRKAMPRLAGTGEGVTVYPSDLDDLQRLAPDDRAVLYLVHVEGRPFADAAAALGCTEEAARARASRARRRLRAELVEEEQ